ncbi:hypothetical protein GGS21DRAFT_493001 [Xylaria nigripes]|nr:hypothetical protein GGS21DRAFT_493001 [Xylaria nigripes]
MAGPQAILVITYLTSALALLIVACRIGVPLWRRDRIDVSLGLAVVSALSGITGIITGVNQFDTTVFSSAPIQGGSLDAIDPALHKTRCILTLITRALVTVFLWSQISILLLFYSRLTFGIAWVVIVVRITWAIVVTTFTANILITFLECRPFSLYWQVSPNPGNCVHAYGQLLTQTISNIVLDVLLIIIACPIIGLRKRAIGERITLFTLFTLGIFCTIVSIIRIITVRGSNSSQAIRTLWAAVQVFVAAFVANAPYLYGSIRVIRARRLAGNRNNFAIISHISLSEAERRRKGPETILNSNDWADLDLAPLTLTYMVRPLAPAKTIFDEETAQAPYDHLTLPG